MNKMQVFFIGKLRYCESLELDNDFTAQRFDDEIQAFNAVAENKPKIVVLDYAMRNAGTPEYIELLLRASPASSIVVLAGSLAEGAIIDVLVAGAQGYAEQRDIARIGNKMLKAIRQGEAWVSRKMVAKLLERLRQAEADKRQQTAIRRTSRR